MQNRRSIVIAAGVTAAMRLLAPGSSRAAAPPFRRNAMSPEGKAMLRIYAEAVRKMKELSARDPKAWTFQWYVHATPKPKADLLQQVFGTTTGPAAKLADETWYTCRSHQGEPEDHFLPWHRLYLMYFEEIVRAVSKRPDFTLPYWDYTEAASFSIPEEFRRKNKDDPLFASLYVDGRNRAGPGSEFADVNGGEPLNKNVRAGRDFLALPDLNEASYSRFCSGLDAGLHGAVHTYTGDASNMGAVPTAAGDPIFWLHHCNVDRIWAAWNARGHANPTETDGRRWSETRFVFADGQGQRVAIPISSIGETTKLPYSYDSLPGGAARSAAVKVADGSSTLLRSTSARSPSPAGAAATPPTSIPLGAESRTVILAPADGIRGNLSSFASAPPPGGPSRFDLVLGKVQARENPNTTYEVFLDLPEGASSDVADLHFVGRLNFFGLVATQGHAGHGATGRDVRFDVTELVTRLSGTGKLKEATTVTLVPVGTPAAGSAPVIGDGVVLQRR